MNMFSSKKKPYFALVINLESLANVVLKTTELYILKANGEASQLKPKSDTDFSKTKEYGVKGRGRNGENVMIRHVIVELSRDQEALKKRKLKRDSGGERGAVPKRLSMGPVVEDLSAYSFPVELKNNKKQKRDAQQAVKQSKSMATDQILNEYLQRGKGSHKLETKPVEPKDSALPISTTMNPGHSQDFTASNLNQSHSEDLPTSNMDPSQSKDPTAASGRGGTDNALLDKLKKFLQSCLEEEFHKSRLDLEQIRQDLQQTRQDLDKIAADVSTIKDLLCKKATRDDEKRYTARKTRQSRLLELPNNLMKDDDEEVQKDKFKYDDGKYLSLEELKNVEKEVYVTNRTDRLCDFMCKGKAGEFSVDSKKKEKFKFIPPEWISIMIRIMLHCSWSYNCDKCDFESVRARLIKHTSKRRNEMKSQILNSLTDEEKVVHKEMVKRGQKVSGEGESDLDTVGSSSGSEDDDEEEEVDEEVDEEEDEEEEKKEEKEEKVEEKKEEKEEKVEEKERKKQNKKKRKKRGSNGGRSDDEMKKRMKKISLSDSD